MDVRGKVAIVTGGATSIGREFATAYVAAGANVCIADIDDAAARETAEALNANGFRCLSAHTDVSKPDDVARLISECVGRFGRIDILVNNAALAAALPPRSLDALDVSEWDAIMAVNLRGPFLCAKAVSTVMTAQRSGKIINMSSTAAYKGHEGRIAYATSKAGLLGLTRSLARAFGRHGICVNALVPGSTASAGTLAIRPLEHFERAAGERCIPRVELPSDLVGALLFLSSAASDFVTGQALVVDGGVEMR